MSARYRAMPPQVRDLGRPWASLVGRVDGLTSELETEFRFGQRVIFFNGRYRLGGNIKGGSSTIWHLAAEQDHLAYEGWQVQEGLAGDNDPEPFQRLLFFLAGHGIDLSSDDHCRAEPAVPRFQPRLGEVYRLTEAALRALPDRHLDGPSFLRLQLGGWGPDGAKGSAYEDGTVMIYDFAVDGARRTFLGLLLHEVGHAFETALRSEMRERLLPPYRAVAAADALMGVEFLLDGRTRQLYQRSFFNEFLAEMYMVYTSQGEILRGHIVRQDAALRGPWEAIYGCYVDAFDGIEYL